jgi:hypothetical protein
MTAAVPARDELYRLVFLQDDDVSAAEAELACGLLFAALLQRGFPM